MFTELGTTAEVVLSHKKEALKVSVQRALAEGPHTELPLQGQIRQINIHDIVCTSRRRVENDIQPQDQKHCQNVPHFGLPTQRNLTASIKAIS